MDANGSDVTQAFHLGASRCLEQLRDAGHRVPCQIALRAGSGTVYDGSFTGALVPGVGVAAQLFHDAGITVLDESQVKVGRAARPHATLKQRIAP